MRGWVASITRLPDAGTPVLGWHPDWGTCVVIADRDRFGMSYWSRDDSVPSAPTHWRPLPDR